MLSVHTRVLPASPPKLQSVGHVPMASCRHLAGLHLLEHMPALLWRPTIGTILLQTDLLLLCCERTWSVQNAGCHPLQFTHCAPKQVFNTAAVRLDQLRGVQCNAWVEEKTWMG